MRLEIGPEAFRWSVVESTVAECTLDPTSIRLTSKPIQYQYLLVSAPFRVRYGACELRYSLPSVAGALTVGFVDTAANQWFVQKAHDRPYSGVLRFTAPSGGLSLQLIVAGNNDRPKPLEVRLDVAGLFHTANPLVPIAWTVRSLPAKWRRRYRVKGRPRLYRIRLKWQIEWTRIRSSLSHFGLAPRQYGIIGSAEVGYAVRSIADFTAADGRRRLITADVGDDSCSFLPVDAGRLGTRHVLTFPKQSRPMNVVPVRYDDGSEVPLVSLFNFDTSGQVCPTTSVVAVKDPACFSSKAAITDLAQDTEIVLARSGYWGYRGSAILPRGDGSFVLGVADRDKGVFHVLDGRARAGHALQWHAAELDIGTESEPIGVGVHVPSLRARPVFYMTLRRQAEILSVCQDDTGGLVILQRLPIDGRSRSSVAIGRFRPSVTSLAVCTWGGDPEDLNSIGYGKLVVTDIDAEGRLREATHYAAGMHPTDVTVGDFDGDGLDEVAVLNYGNGLAIGDRTNAGNVQIFKWRSGSMRCVATVAVPSPRIGLASDIDSDGVQELIVSLFFERQVVVVKYDPVVHRRDLK